MIYLILTKRNGKGIMKIMISKSDYIKKMQIQLDTDNELTQHRYSDINYELRNIREILISIADSLYEINKKMNND